MLSKFQMFLLDKMVGNFCFNFFIVDENVIFVFNVVSRITGNLNAGERRQIYSAEDKILSSRNNI